MALKQLSVFLENREGRLEDLFQVFEVSVVLVQHGLYLRMCGFLLVLY